MKILVTGGAGYLGSIFVPLLLQEKHDVIVLDNFLYNQTSLLDCCHFPNLKVINGDVRDYRLLAGLVKKADAIFPLACITGMPACNRDPITAKMVNYDAVKQIAGLKSKNQIIIFPTTNSGYGTTDGSVYCTEETPLNPISLYGKLKAQAEKAILNAGNSITLRLATAFGISPRMRLDLLVNDFVYRAVKDRFIVLFEAHFKRNFIHVRDIAKVFFHCLKNFGKMKNETYNVGLSNANISKFELCGKIKEIVPDFYFVEAEIGRDPDRRNYIVSNEKIEKTGFRPGYSLEKGIEELVKGYAVIKTNCRFSNI